MSTFEANLKVKSVKFCFAQSDIFYMPKRLFNSFNYISSIYESFNITLELAVPLIIVGLDLFENINELKGKYQWECNSCFSFDLPLNECKLKYNQLTHFYHAIKITTLLLHNNNNNPQSNRNFCKLFLNETVF